MTFEPTFSRPFSPTFDRRNAGGWWWNAFGAISAANCIAAYQPKGAADLAASYINLTGNATYNCTVVTNAPGWDSTNGWKVTAGAMALNTNIVATNAHSSIIRFSNGSATTSAMLGMISGTAVRHNIYNHYTDTNAYFRSGGTYNTTGVNYDSGVLAVTPATAYANGSPLGNLASAYSSTATLTHYVCGGNGLGNEWRGYQQAVSFYNITLSDAQVTALTNAMNAL